MEGEPSGWDPWLSPPEHLPLAGPALTRWWRSSRCGAEARWDNRTWSLQGFTLDDTTPVQISIQVLQGTEFPKPSERRMWTGGEAGGPRMPNKGTDELWVDKRLRG